MEATILIDSLLALFALIFIVQLLLDSISSSVEPLSSSGFEKKSLLNQKVMRRMAWS